MREGLIDCEDSGVRERGQTTDASADPDGMNDRSRGVWLCVVVSPHSEEKSTPNRRSEGSRTGTGREQLFARCDCHVEVIECVTPAHGASVRANRRPMCGFLASVESMSGRAAVDNSCRSSAGKLRNPGIAGSGEGAAPICRSYQPRRQERRGAAPSTVRWMPRPPVHGCRGRPGTGTMGS